MNQTFSRDGIMSAQRHTFFILNLLFDIVNGVRRLDIKGDGFAR